MSRFHRMHPEDDQAGADVREFNARLDAAEFEDDHGETPQDRAVRRQELREQIRRELVDGRMA